MRICHVTSMHAWDDDRIFERACRRLARDGHEVKLVATADGPRIVDGVAIVPVASRSGWRRRLLSSLAATWAAGKLGCDVVHFHDPDLLPWMLFLASRGRRVVYDAHEDYAVRFDQWALPDPLRRPLARVFRALERAAVRRFAAVVAPDDAILSRYDGASRDGAVVRNTHDLETLASLSNVPPQDPFPVVYTSGSNLPDRNCVQMVDALPLILERVPAAVLRFAGTYAPGLENELRARARQAGVEASLELLGPLPYLEHFARSFRAHVGCVFLADTPKNHFANSNRLFEYMYCALPVLAEDLPGPRAVVEAARCGLIVDSRDPRAIAESAAYLLTHPEEAAEMGRRGREAVLAEHNFAVDYARLDGLYGRITRGIVP
jgi:glycosyltransferase involved in cell wall biosynthesis